MFNHKKFLLLSLILSVFFITSCGEKPSEPHDVINNDPNISFNWNNKPGEIKSGGKLPVDDFVVSYGNFNQNLKFLGEGSKEYENNNVFFISSNPTYPTNSIVTNLTVTTNVERNDLTFYICTFQNNNVCVSGAQSITIVNSDALKPWVWYVVTGVVIFGVVAMVVFTKRYKEKHSK